MLGESIEGAKKVRPAVGFHLEEGQDILGLCSFMCELPIALKERLFDKIFENFVEYCKN